MANKETSKKSKLKEKNKDNKAERKEQGRETNQGMKKENTTKDEYV